MGHTGVMGADRAIPCLVRFLAVHTLIAGPQFFETRSPAWTKH